MNWDRIEGNWKQFKGRARQQWGKLTDDELEQIKGHREELVGRIQETLRDRARRGRAPGPRVGRRPLVR